MSQVFTVTAGNRGVVELNIGGVGFGSVDVRRTAGCEGSAGGATLQWKDARGA